MADEIPLRPHIPAQLRVAASKGSVVPFVGAGLSMLAVCPDWGAFSGGALKVFVDAGKINHSQLIQIRTLPPRTQISLAMAMAREHRIEIEFERLLKPNGARLKDEGIRAYASLGKLSSTFVTTNYEDLLDTVIPAADDGVTPQEASSVPVATKRNVYSRVEEFTYAALNQGNSVFHIHGSMAAPDGMILTTRDYLTRYANHSIDGGSYNENPYLAFLEMLFRTKNVLFVGYRLAELEILEYVIHKARSTTRGALAPEEPRHFLLTGFYSHELELKRSLERYYATDCGVQLLPFSLDQKGWNQLVDVLEYMSQELPAQSLLQLQRRNELRGLLE
jgi:hypothetical protein